MEKEPILLDSSEFHKIWVKQCEAAERIKLRYESKAAFDYVVAEKLFNFADAAATHSEFARELPRFVARVRGLFTVEEIRAHLNRIELERREYEAHINERDGFDEQDEQQEEDALSLESTAAAEERARQFAVIAELLSAGSLGPPEP